MSPGFVSHPSASQNEAAAEPMEELTYRRSLRVALDILNERPCSRQEICSRKEGAAGFAGRKHTEPATWLCDPSPSSLVHEDLSGSSQLKRRERVYPRLVGFPSCGKDPRCQVDCKKGLGEDESPLALVVSARGGSQDGRRSKLHLESRRTLNKRGRSLAQEPSWCQNGPSVSEGHWKRESEEEAGSWAASSLPSLVRKQGLWAKGHLPDLSWGSPTVRPACLDAQGPPAKQLLLDCGQRSGPQGCMTLRSATRLCLPTHHATTEDARLPALEEGKACPMLGQGGALVLPPRPPARQCL